MNQVTINIANDKKTIKIDWKPDMNIQNMLEIAYDQEKKSGREFSFAFQYFGYYGEDYLGYLVIMIDKIYDNPNNPNDYWLYRVNGVTAQVGIDNYMVNAGDLIEFDYIPITSSAQDNFLHKVKHEFYSNN